MYFLRAILLAQLVVTCVLAQRVQEWGQLGPSGFLLHEQQIQVLQQSGHNGTAILRRTIQYPDFVSFTGKSSCDEVFQWLLHFVSLFDRSKMNQFQLHSYASRIMAKVRTLRPNCAGAVPVTNMLE